MERQQGIMGTEVGQGPLAGIWSYVTGNITVTQNVGISEQIVDFVLLPFLLFFKKVNITSNIVSMLRLNGYTEH